MFFNGTNVTEVSQPDSLKISDMVLPDQSEAKTSSPGLIFSCFFKSFQYRENKSC